MKKIGTVVMVSLLFSLVVLFKAAPQEGEGGGSEGGGSSYGPGETPTIPGTDVPAPAGLEGVDVAPAGGEGGGGEGGEGGEGPLSGDASTYIEGRRDKVVFETTCFKCHPKEKVLAFRRTETQWNDIVIKKHLAQGRIDMSAATPVLRYLVENYGPKKPAAPATPGTTPPAAPTATPVPLVAPVPTAAPAPAVTPPSPQPAGTAGPAAP